MQKLKQIKATSTNACPMGGGVVGVWQVCGGVWCVVGVWWGCGGGCGGCVVGVWRVCGGGGLRPTVE